MTTLKIKWKVEAAPTGHYRSFQRRGWPSAIYENLNQDTCAMIQCEDEYVPARVKDGRHQPLKLRVADYSEKSRQWRLLPGSFATLDQAKAAVADFLESNPHLSPNVPT